MIPRYTRPEMAAIWTSQTRLRIWYELEAHAADAMAELGIIPKGTPVDYRQPHDRARFAA